MLVIDKVLLAALGPAQGQFHRSARAFPGRWIFGAFVERHDDVGAQPDLRGHRVFRTEEVRRPIEMGAKRDAVFGQPAQFAEAENLEAAGVGENRPVPRHKVVQAAQPANGLDPGTKVEMVSVAEENLDPEFFKKMLRNAFDRTHGTDGHEHRSFDLGMRGGEPAEAGGTGGSANLEAN